MKNKINLSQNQGSVKQGESGASRAALKDARQSQAGTAAPEITVYYDGLCRLCDAEIAHYKKSEGSGKINFVDITLQSFDPAAEGLDPFAVHKVMHVRRADGSLATKVDAFIEIWKMLPRYQWMARLASGRALRPVLDIGYEGFAKVRPYLPKKSRTEDCSASPYCEVKNVKTTTGV